MKKRINEATNGKLSGLTPISTGSGHKLNAEAAAAYEKMVQAAKNDGVSWGITDSYRDYETQNRIFDWDHYKSTGKKRKKGTSGTPVAYPGKSNHGWGSAVDLKVKYGDNAHTWLTRNASKFGFSNPFKNPRTEPWHWEHKQSAKNMGSNISVEIPDSSLDTDITIPTDGSASDTTPKSPSIIDKVFDKFLEPITKGASLQEEIKRIKNLLK